MAVFHALKIISGILSTSSISMDHLAIGEKKIYNQYLINNTVNKIPGQLSQSQIIFLLMEIINIS